MYTYIYIPISTLYVLALRPRFAFVETHTILKRVYPSCVAHPLRFVTPLSDH